MPWVTDEQNQEQWVEEQPAAAAPPATPPMKASPSKLILIGAALAALAIGLFIFGRKKKGS